MIDMKGVGPLWFSVDHESRDGLRVWAKEIEPPYRSGVGIRIPLRKSFAVCVGLCRRSGAHSEAEVVGSHELDLTAEEIGDMEPVLCTLCEEELATTTWGFPVCESCAIGLGDLQIELEAMEDADPDLKASRERLESSWEIWQDRNREANDREASKD